MFKVVYTSLKVLGGEYQKIVFDSATDSMALTRNLASSTLADSEGKAKTQSKRFQSQSQSQTQSSKTISYSEREQLIRTIRDNKFFQTDIFYPPDPMGTQDHTLFVLAVKFEEKIHSSIWADTSRNVPAGHVSIVKALQEIASG